MTLDLKCPGPLKNVPIIIGGKPDDSLVYGEFEREAHMILDAFVEVLNEGDADGKLLPYPILTFNVTKDFDWEGYDNIFELAAKTGAPYFANFCHGGLSEDDVFSMCCRLRLDMRELRNKAGGLFGAAENTGSIGVFTINLPALGYRNNNAHEFFADLDEQLELGYQQLEAKRKAIEHNLKNGLYPATREYLDRGFATFFSSFGIVGAHEMCLNRLGVGIDDPAGRDLTKEVIEYIKLKLSNYQEQSGNMYNLEYTPAESTAYRLAMKDKKRYPEIITAGGDEPYYTNSTHLPVGNSWNWHEVFKHQQELLPLATGGSVYHAYLDHEISMEQARKFIKTVLTSYDIPYLSLSPRYSVCTEGCGVLIGHQEVCPKCGEKADVYQRVTGYVRKVSSFNAGKLEEYKERFQRKCY
jgi:ribonucleoside-triphosphate reductase